MKSYGSLLVIAFGIGSFSASAASWTITPPVPVTVKAGATGTSTILIDPGVSGKVTSLLPETEYVTGLTYTWLISGAPDIVSLSPFKTEANPFTSWSSAVSTKNFTAGNDFDDVVSWTVAPNAPVGDYTFHVTLDYTKTGSILPTTQSLGTFQIDVAAAPEPGQVIAGLMLLGVGGVVFASRRWVKKPAISPANN